MNHDEAMHLAGRGLAEALQAQTQEASAGLIPAVRDALEPHDANPGVGTPPLEAWEAASERLGWAGIAPPAAWGTLVLEAARVPHVVCAPGDYPQRLDVTALLKAPTAREESDGVVSAGLLESWAGQQKQPNNMVLAAGVLRVAGNRQAAAQMLQRAIADGAHSDHVANLQGALAFDAGDMKKAHACWTLLPEGPTRWHNLGLLAWLTGEPARELFAKARAGIDERDPWHHLAALYADVASD